MIMKTTMTKMTIVGLAIVKSVLCPVAHISGAYPVFWGIKWLVCQQLAVRYFSLLLSSVPSESPPNTIIKPTSSSTIGVSWKPINQAHVYGILLGYEVRYTKNDEIPLTWKTKTLGVHVDRTVLRDLVKFAPYKVVICAKTSKGCGKEHSTITHTWDDGELNTTRYNYLKVQYCF